MSERVQFHFEGQLADKHKLNYYEAARFQYATARLLVKLAQFRDSGNFNKRIHESSNFDVLLETHKEGSFDITVLAPVLMAGYEAFVSTSLSALMTYVFERIVGKSSNAELAKTLNTIDNVTDTFGKISADNASLLRQALELVEKDRDQFVAKTDSQVELYERLLAEKDRVILLERNAAELRKINSVSEQKLISMSAPLVKEMATVLRTSADSLQVISEDKSGEERNILYLNKRMAKQIENDTVDTQMTAILGNIIQYNKENGWGKIRADFPNSPISFNIPSDVKSSLQSKILAAMGKEKIYMRTYIVRNKAKEAIRLVVVGIMDAPPE
ncbi:hypothetical protein IPU75_05185 [Ochrobactrum sp. SD129]|nr:hypothetical protein [Ochrobactrum sp. SD129]